MLLGHLSQLQLRDKMLDGDGDEAEVADAAEVAEPEHLEPEMIHDPHLTAHLFSSSHTLTTIKSRILFVQL